MDRFRHSIPLMLMVGIFLASAPMALAQQHWEDHEITPGNMSLLIDSATLDGESLVEDDEIAAFSPEGTFAGNGIVTNEGFPVGLPVWGDDPDEQGMNGMRNREEIVWKVWDHQADEEWSANVEVDWGENVYERDGFTVVLLSAAREQAPDIDIADMEYDFGAVRVGQQVTWNTSIDNVGNAVLTIQSVDVNGEGFSTNFQDAVEVDAGGSYSLEVYFSPGQSGDFAADMVITSDDPDEGEVNVSLTGSGQDALPPSITVSAADRRFGRVLIDQSREMTLFIGNSGDDDLIVSDISTGDGAFTTDFEGEYTITSGDRHGLVITFTPDHAGVFETQLAITSNDPDQEVTNVTLSGEGIEQAEAAMATILVEEHFYGAVVNGQSMAWRMGVTNMGGSDLHISDVTNDNEAFTADYPGGTIRLRPGDYFFVNTHFAPNAEAFFDGMLTVVSDDEQNGELSIPVAGIGVGANGRNYHAYNSGVNHSLIITATTLDGNAVAAGTEVAVFTESGLCAGSGVVGNDGQAGIAAYGDDPTSDIIDGFADGESFTFKVWDANRRMDAMAEATFDEGPEVYTADEWSALSLAAETGAPQGNIVLSAMDYDYGQVSLDEGEDWVFTVSNDGEGSLTVSSIEPDINELTTDFDGAFDLASGESRDITVTFNPQAQIDYMGRLTVMSNDPIDSVLYIDLIGQGVDVVREPVIALGAPNHFFGALKLNRNASYVLRISDEGLGDLRITDIAVEGVQSFTTDFEEAFTIRAGEFADLTITYTPTQVRTAQANIVITSNDPNRGVVRFLVEGDGVDEASNFHARVTNRQHDLFINQLTFYMPGDRSSALAPGDEVGVFTPSGLCAGFVVVEEQGAPVLLSAYGDDPNTAVVDGFRNGEAFTFRLYDWSTRAELEADVEWPGEPVVFTAGEQSDVTEVSAFNDEQEAQIAVDPADYQFGAVHVNTDATMVYHVMNTGGVNLTVSRITSSLNVFTHNFNNQETVIEPDGSIDVTVTFRPTAAAPYEGVLTVFSDDPDQPQFTFRANGSGSNQAGHFDFLPTDRNHSILVEHFLMGGEPAPVGDEIGVYTESGICAGAGIVEDPGQVGLPAWRDDPDTEVIEGFGNDDPMFLRVYDRSQGREYTEFDHYEVTFGEMNWEADGFTVVDLSIDDIFALIGDPGAVQIAEGNDVAIHFTIANPPGDMAISFLDADLIPQNSGNVTFTDNGDNTADFLWETNLFASRPDPYAFRFRASDDNGNSDMTTVIVTIDSVNQRPEVRAPFDNDEVTFLEDNNNAVPLNDTFTVVQNLRQMFVDPDGDLLSFSLESINPENMYNDFRTFNNIRVFRIATPANYSGDIQVTLRANDNRNGMPGRDEFARSLRSIFGANSIVDMSISNPSETPTRDETVDYSFTVHITPVNDIPIITSPANVPGNGQQPYVWAIDEREQSQLDFDGSDVETAHGDLVWTMPERGNLPDECVFTDNDDGTAQIVWTPTPADIGRYENLQVRLADGDDAVRNFALTIVVSDVNDAPVYLDDNQNVAEPNPIPDVEIDEDMADRLVIATLSEHFADPDPNANLRFGYRPNGQPADLQPVYDANSTELSILPRANIFGEYDITVFCTDGALEATHDIHVTVNSINDLPRNIGAIAAPGGVNGLAEDVNLNRTLIVRLSSRFSDVDAGDVLTYTINDVPAELGLQVNANTTELTYQLTPNYNTEKDFGIGNGPLVTITATDQAGDTATASFIFKVRFVEDPPNAFNLLIPSNNFVIQGADSIAPVTFNWNVARQNPWEMDTVRYEVLAVPENTRDTLRYVGYNDTTVTVPMDSLRRMILRDRDLTIVWNVRANDRTPTLPSANGAFRVILRALEIKELPEAEMPQDYFMSNSYPNPFNARTTLQFGLPTPGEVTVTVWDMHGRQVANLTEGYHNAGQYELTWTADGMTSGIYLIKMQSGSFVGMRKAILVR